ncbi:MAG TPA: hypothetical protein VK553_07650 [Candidatus Nitrosopolaris rasttigaisensis]|nr:hypothetical protein [Candidatus Nitrosopolaris rasttigaisensis]
MDQAKKKITSINPHEGQFFYKDRWVNKEHFRAFVYSEKDKRLAKSYKEFESLLASGLWFIEKPEAKLEVKPEIKIAPLKRKPKHGSADS